MPENSDLPLVGSKDGKSADSSAEPQVTLSEQEYNNLKKAADESKANYDKFLRIYADFENFKKRMIKEKADFLKFASEDIMLEILGAIDNFNRAKQSFAGGASLEKVVEGIDLVYQQMMGILNKRGLEPIDALHKPFDPESHEAIGFLDSDDHPDHTVLEEIQKGFKLQGRLLRPALVQISRRKKSDSTDGPATENRPEDESPHE